MKVNEKIRTLLQSDDVEGYRTILSECLSEESAFIYEIHDYRQVFGREWGGEFRVCINQNIVLHFVPGLCDEMAAPEELPQFLVFACDEKAGDDEHIEHPGFDDLEPFSGVIFNVSRAEYRTLAIELTEILATGVEIQRIPDSLFLDTTLVTFFRNRILANAIIQDERQYDFSKQTF